MSGLGGGGGIRLKNRSENALVIHRSLDIYIEGTYGKDSHRIENKPKSKSLFIPNKNFTGK